MALSSAAAACLAIGKRIHTNRSTDIRVYDAAQAEDRAAWQEVVRMKEKRLHREKTILSRQRQVLLKLPTKREKVEVCCASSL